MAAVIFLILDLNVIFFVFFIVVCQFTMLSLFILILMQQFEQNYINDDNIMSKFNEMSEVFKNLWITYADSQNILYLKKYMLLDFY